MFFLHLVKEKRGRYLRILKSMTTLNSKLFLWKKYFPEASNSHACHVAHSVGRKGVVMRSSGGCDLTTLALGARCSATAASQETPS